MIQAVEKYATMLKELEIPEDVIEQALDIFQTVPVLMEQFCNPAADLAGKHRAIDKIFPSQIRDMIKVMCCLLYTSLRSHTSDHNIIQQTYKICNPILDHNRNCNQQNHLIKLLISYKFLNKRIIFVHKNSPSVCTKCSTLILL